MARRRARRKPRYSSAGRLQILAADEPRPNQPGVAEHHREQPDDALDPRLVGKLDLEPGEVDLGLLAQRRLEAVHLTYDGWRQPGEPVRQLVRKQLIIRRKVLKTLVGVRIRESPNLVSTAVRISS